MIAAYIEIGGRLKEAAEVASVAVVIAAVAILTAIASRGDDS